MSDTEVSDPLRSKGGDTGNGGETLMVPQFWNGEQVTQTLDAVLAKGQTMPEKNRFPAVLVPTACAFGGDVARTLSARHDSSPCADRGMDVVAITENMRGEVRETEYANALTKGGGKPGQGYSAARVAMQVRRLTPVECARLQGFPDDHTKIEWRGRLEEDCPDGPQYKAYGNSMAVPCMAWLGRRIAEFGFPDPDRGLYDEE